MWFFFSVFFSIVSPHISCEFLLWFTTCLLHSTAEHPAEPTPPPPCGPRPVPGGLWNPSTKRGSENEQLTPDPRDPPTRLDWHHITVKHSQITARLSTDVNNGTATIGSLPRLGLGHAGSLSRGRGVAPRCEALCQSAHLKHALNVFYNPAS